ncbi:MAG: endonuclease/exonuclease/phosphatase family protein [Candidatus Thiodiazotropha sp.]
MSLNVRGINDNNKRKKLFTWMLDRRADIYFLQETKLQEKCRKLVDFEWNGKCFHAFSDSAKSGVSILIKQKLNFSLLNEHSSNDGRKLLLNIEIGENIFTLVSIYAPNDEKCRKDFIKKSERWIKKYALNENNIVIGGDWNCCMNDSDRNTLTHINDSSRKCFKSLVDNLDLTDM